MDIEIPFRCLDCTFYDFCLSVHVRYQQLFSCTGCKQYRPALRSIEEWGEECLRLMKLFCRAYPELVGCLVSPQVIQDILNPPPWNGEDEQEKPLDIPL